MSEETPSFPELDVASESRRADIITKQAIIARILADMKCEAVLLLMPAHIAWFSGGINIRGLIADGERPGIYTNGRQRWLLCSNLDSQRLFDEELDGMGFMLKEWQWPVGRATLLGDLVAGKKIACDRPFPGMPGINERLRQELRPLFPSDRARAQALGEVVAHSLEATARNLKSGETEREIAGQLAHRVYHHGAEVAGISVTAEDRSAKYRRSGFTDAKVERFCTLQLTAMRDGLYITASRSVSFGPIEEATRQAMDAAIRISAVFRTSSTPNNTISHVVDTSANLMRSTPYEHEWRLNQPGYSAGWFPADELRKAGVDEKFVEHQALVWQARIGAISIVDSSLVSEQGAIALTPVMNWPFKRVRLNNHDFDIPDILQH